MLDHNQSGRIVVVGNRPIRRQQKRADYLLRYRRDFAIAVVEAKAAYRTAGDGLQEQRNTPKSSA
jgi:type I restriction enzyme R subunit